MRSCGIVHAWFTQGLQKLLDKLRDKLTSGVKAVLREVRCAFAGV
jgi:hypothetical protein